MPIQPTYGTLLNLITDKVFKVPEYQRFYSWKRKQRQDLFSDLVALSARPVDQQHFMATLVCFDTGETEQVGPINYRLFDIVDGQQRLTSLVILLKCLAGGGNLQDGTRTMVEQALVKADGNLILLQTNNENRHLFAEFLTTGATPTEESIETYADQNLRNAITESKKFVASWEEETGSDINHLAAILFNRLGFICWEIDDERTVFSIFEVLNSRGLAVDWLDKTKAILMERAHSLSPTDAARGAAINNLKAIWASIYKELAKCSLSGDEVLRVTATLRHGPKGGKPQGADDALQQLRSECVEAGKEIEVSSELLDVTRRLARIDRKKHLGPVKKVLQARILAVSLDKANQLGDSPIAGGPSEREKAMLQWERVTCRIFGIGGKDSRSKVGEYVRLAAKVQSRAEGAMTYAEVMSGLRHLGRDYQIASVITSGLRCTAIYDDPELCRFLLWRYEEYLAGSLEHLNPVDRVSIWEAGAQNTIEHIFPQNPEEGGPWSGKMSTDGEEKDHWSHVHRIGNLCLLSKELNQGNGSFAVKKRMYSAQALLMYNEIVSKDDWTLAEIEERESQICEWAEKAWGDLPD